MQPCTAITLPRWLIPTHNFSKIKRFKKKNEIKDFVLNKNWKENSIDISNDYNLSIKQEKGYRKYIVQIRDENNIKKLDINFSYLLLNVNTLWGVNVWEGLDRPLRVTETVETVGNGLELITHSATLSTKMAYGFSILNAKLLLKFR